MQQLILVLLIIAIIAVILRPIAGRRRSTPVVYEVIRNDYPRDPYGPHRPVHIRRVDRRFHGDSPYYRR